MARSRLVRAGRRTNVSLLILLVVAFGTGGLAFATAGSIRAAAITTAHGLAGLAVLGLAPWKSVIIHRARVLPLASLALLILILICLIAGFVEVFVGYDPAARLSPIQVHVGSAVVVLVLIGWHISRHRPQRLRRLDLSRRRLIMAGAFGLGVGAVYAASEGVGRLVRSPSADRLSTGSHALPADQIPATIWLLDRTPETRIDKVRVAGRSFSPADLDARGRPVVARLDCTSGWYADVTWWGVPLSELFDGSATASVLVTSVTGYHRTFAATESGRLWLVTRQEGRALDSGHGGPVRLVAEGYRGFWWVKWVDLVEVSDRPVWIQSPFPLQ